MINFLFGVEIGLTIVFIAVFIYFTKKEYEFKSKRKK